MDVSEVAVLREREPALFARNLSRPNVIYSIVDRGTVRIKSRPIMQLHKTARQFRILDLSLESHRRGGERINPNSQCPT